MEVFKLSSIFRRPTSASSARCLLSIVVMREHAGPARDAMPRMKRSTCETWWVCENCSPYQFLGCFIQIKQVSIFGWIANTNTKHRKSGYWASDFNIHSYNQSLPIVQWHPQTNEQTKHANQVNKLSLTKQANQPENQHQRNDQRSQPW